MSLLTLLLGRLRRRPVVTLIAASSGRFTYELSNGAAFVREGDQVYVGRPLGFLEEDDGMTSDIATPIAGRVLQIVAKNGQRVEAGEVLMFLEQATT